MLRHSRFCLKIILFMGIICAIAGCGTNNPYIATGEMNIKAETVPEGIRITFSDIPPETVRMFIHISDWGGKKEVTGSTDIVSRFADIRGEDLERVKTSGEVICPFVKSGLPYEIAVCYAADNEPESGEWAFAECTARSGTYFESGPELSLNENLTAVTLSAEPEFTSEVQYDSSKYQYGITIKKDEYWSIGVGGTSAGEAMTWQFQPLLTDDVTAGGYLESGDYPAYAVAYCNAVYDDLTWAVEVAKSREFTVHF